MSKEGGIEQCNIPVRAHLAYYKWMTGKKGAEDPSDLNLNDLHQSHHQVAEVADNDETDLLNLNYYHK